MSIVTEISDVLAPGLNNLQAQAGVASEQLQLAFQVLIAEGAVACILLLLIFIVLTRKN